MGRFHLAKFGLVIWKSFSLWTLSISWSLNKK